MSFKLTPTQCLVAIKYYFFQKDFPEIWIKLVVCKGFSENPEKFHYWYFSRFILMLA